MTTGNKIETKEITLAEAKIKYNGLGLGLAALAGAAGVSWSGVSNYMGGRIPVGKSRLRISDSLCRVLQVDKIIYPDDDQRGE